MKSIFFSIWQAALPMGLVSVMAVASAPKASAQNTGGVFPPMVNADHKSAQYRIAYNDDTQRFNQRVHYQQAINGDFMWRVIGQTRKTSDSDFDFDYVQGELFWELSGDDDMHKSGLRFDARLRDDDRSNILGVNWMNQFNFDNGWSARALLLTSVQIGDNAGDGVGLQTRFQVNKRLDNGPNLGAELYNNYGTTDDGLGRFDDQNHTFGPYVNWPISQGWSVFTGPLFGLSDGAPDTEYRLWITKSL